MFTPFKICKDCAGIYQIPTEPVECSIGVCQMCGNVRQLLRAHEEPDPDPHEERAEDWNDFDPYYDDLTLVL